MSLILITIYLYDFLINIYFQNYCVCIQVLTNILNFNSKYIFIYIFCLYLTLTFEVFLFLISKALILLISVFLFSTWVLFRKLYETLCVHLFCKFYFNLQCLILIFSVNLPLIIFSHVSDTSFIFFRFIIYLSLRLDLSLYNHF